MFNSFKLTKELEDLLDNKKSVKKKKRKGKGQGSGLGKTSGRGHKGQKARGAGKVAVGFEGGQTPIYMKAGKFGFKSLQQKAGKKDVIIHFKLISQLIESGKLTKDITLESIQKSGIAKSNQTVKFVATGEPIEGLTIEVNKISENAKKILESNKGSVKIV